MSIALPLEWLASYTEEPIDPDRPIVDPHHHLWPAGGPVGYGVDELVGDTAAGHNVVKTVFVECGAGYDPGDTDPSAPVAETVFVAAAADDLSARYPDRAPIAGIVGHADLRSPELDDILDAHEQAGGGRFRGIRDALSRALEPDVLMIPGLAECFGPQRCMFESNFPVDKLSASAGVVWNFFKKLVADCSEEEQTAMFSGTATRVYDLDR